MKEFFFLLLGVFTVLFIIHVSIMLLIDDDNEDNDG